MLWEEKKKTEPLRNSMRQKLHTITDIWYDKLLIHQYKYIMKEFVNYLFDF